MTRDIDIILGIDTDELNRVLNIAQELNLEILPRDVTTFVQRTHVLPLRDSESAIRVDFIFSFSPYETEAITRAKKIDIDKTLVNYASPEDVIIHKLIAGRPRDVEDVRGILVRTCQLDREYLHRWLTEFDQALGRNLLVQFKTLYAEVEMK